MPSIHLSAGHRSMVAGALVAAAALLVMIHVGWQLFAYWTGHDYVFGLIKLFHPDEERNVPVLFSTLLLCPPPGTEAAPYHDRARNRQ